MRRSRFIAAGRVLILAAATLASSAPVVRTSQPLANEDLRHVPAGAIPDNSERAPVAVAAVPFQDDATSHKLL